MFFSNLKEFNEKLNNVLKNKSKLENLSNSGFKRAVKDNHDIYSRINNLLSEIEKLKKYV